MHVLNFFITLCINAHVNKSMSDSLLSPSINYSSNGTKQEVLDIIIAEMGRRTKERRKLSTILSSSLPLFYDNFSLLSNVIINARENEVILISTANAKRQAMMPFELATNKLAMNL